MSFHTRTSLPRFTVLRRHCIATGRKQKDSDSLYRAARCAAEVCREPNPRRHQGCRRGPAEPARPGHRRALPPLALPVCPPDWHPRPQRWSWTPAILSPFLLLCRLQKVMGTGPCGSDLRPPRRASSSQECLRDSLVLDMAAVRSLLLPRDAPSSGCAGSFTRLHLRRTASAPVRAIMNGAATDMRI